MTDFQAFLQRTHQNLATLKEREVKYGGNAPVELLNQIEDHQQAIALTEQAIQGELSRAEWEEALEPLLVNINDRTGQAAIHLTIGDVQGGIHDSIIAGHDVYINVVPEPSLPDRAQVLAHRAALTQKVEYRRWADEFYIREESKILPLLASPYDDDSGQQRQDLLQTIRVHERLLVLGEPGMGKTVALERMMWETAQADEPIVPVFVPLLFFQGDLIEAVRVALSETGELHFDESKTVRAFLRQTRCLIMFDGLNEVPGQRRNQVVGAIADFLREFSYHRYLVTSRSQDELWKKLRATEVITEAVVIQRISDTQARAYLMAHLGEQKGSALHDRLDDNLRGLSHTPLLLWLIKEAGLVGEKLPNNRGELFDGFVNRMLARDAKLEFKIEPPVKKRALAHLAFNLQQTHQLACEREQAVQMIGQLKVKDDAQAILQETLKHGLLQGERQVRFLHQSVQEYFVALALAELAKTERGMPAWQRASQRLLRRNLAAWARDDWWAESFVQLAGLTDDSSWLVRELVQVKPWLAYWCSVEGKQVDPEMRALIEKKTVAALSSPEVEQRRRAVSELSRLENLRTIDPLIQALNDNDEGVVNLAVEVLAKLGEPAVNPLLTALSGSEYTRWAATRALGQVWGLEDMVKLGDGAGITRRNEAAQALRKLRDERVVEPLIAALQDSDSIVRWSAANALGKLGTQLKDIVFHSRMLEPLNAALQDSDRDVRRIAAWALGQLGDIRAVEALIASLKDSDEAVRRGATRSLGQIWRLMDLVKLGDNSERVRREAFESLQQLSDARMVEPLIAALKDSDEVVRICAVAGLGILERQLEDITLSARVVELLVATIKDDKPVARMAALAFTYLGASAREPLIAALKDSNILVRHSAAEALGKLGAVEPLIAALKDSDWNVRRSAAEALGKLGVQLEDTTLRAYAVELLITALQDSYENFWGGYLIRQAAAEALRRIGTPEALAAVHEYEAGSHTFPINSRPLLE